MSILHIHDMIKVPCARHLLVFFDAFALIFFMPMNELQLHFFTDGTILRAEAGP